MKTIKFELEPLTCPSCITKIENTLSRKKGIEEAKVLFHSNKVKVKFLEEEVNPDQIASTIEDLGYPVKTAATTL